MVHWSVYARGASALNLGETPNSNPTRSDGMRTLAARAHALRLVLPCSRCFFLWRGWFLCAAAALRSLVVLQRACDMERGVRFLSLRNIGLVLEHGVHAAVLHRVEELRLLLGTAVAAAFVHGPSEAVVLVGISRATPAEFVNIGRLVGSCFCSGPIGRRVDTASRRPLASS